MMSVEEEQNKLNSLELNGTFIFNNVYYDDDVTECFYIKSRMHGKVLDVYKGGKAPGTKVRTGYRLKPTI